MIKLALAKLEEPKGVIYVDLPTNIETPTDVVEAIRRLLGGLKIRLLI